MTTKVTRSKINFTDKDHDLQRLILENLPAGSVIQTNFLVRRADISVNNGEIVIDTLDFQPIFANSLLRLSINYSMGMNNSGQNYYYLIFRDKTRNIELERTGLQRGPTNINQDALTTRATFMHYHYPRSCEKRTYEFRGIGGVNGFVWFHTYGGNASSYFTIEEIKQ